MYLERAAQRVMIDEIRRRGRRPEQVAGEEDWIEAAPGARPDPERVAASGEIAAGIRGCLARLATPRRLAVTLYLQGCRVGEAAHRLGWSFKRTENLVYRGLSDLRLCLRRKGLEP